MGFAIPVDRATKVIQDLLRYGEVHSAWIGAVTATLTPEEAKRLYALFCTKARALGLTVEEGIFAADMKVALINDGPVTICLDSVDRAQR